MSLLDTASLIVTPNGYKEGKLYSVIPSDGSGDMSVVRATTATRVNSAGLVELVPYNLCTYSEDQTQWTSQNETTVTANTTTAPNGTTTADTVTPSTVTDDHYRGIILSPQVGALTAFIYVKPNGYNFFDWGIYNGSQYIVRATFDLVNLTYTFTNAGTATIESVGNGWLKCGISGTNASLSTISLYYRSRPTGGTGVFTGNGTSGAFIWGAQLNEGSTAKDYQKTETRLNIPRLDYSNGTCPSLLVEPQRTNSCLNSSNYSAWLGVNNITITANTTETTSPFGINNASKIVLGASGFRRIFDFFGSVSGNMTISVFVKPATSSSIVLFTSSGSLYCLYDFNTQTTTPQAGTTATITEYENGWYRITATASLSTGEVLQIIFQGNGGDYLYLFGVQTEAGSYSTSYIPTTSASVTRNADVISKTGISSLIGQTEGVVFMDFVAQPTSTSQSHFWIGTSGSEIGLYGNSQFIFYSSGGVSINGGNIVAGTRYKVAFAYKANDYVAYINGTQVGTDTSASVPTTSALYLGSYSDGSEIQEKYINAVALWKTRLTNTQLAQLTTI